MGRAVLLINSNEARDKAHLWIARAPWNSRITFQGPKRTLPQNDLMWCRLTELSERLTWHGQRYSPDDWKDYLMHALKRARWMPDEDGGMVPVGMRTSDLSKEEMGELLDLMDAFAARHGVVWSEPKSPGEETGVGNGAGARMIQREKESA